MTAAPLPSATRWRMLVPFMLVTLIWGSTWIVIRDQLGVVPAAWSVAYRFVLAGVLLLGLAVLRGEGLRMPAGAWPTVAAIGLFQFCLNFNLVYAAEHHVTSGLVAVVFSLLIVPNAILGRIVLGQRLSRPFMIGSGVAIAGIALLFAHEIGQVGARAGAVVFGIGLALAAVMTASVANILQVTERGRALPPAAMLGWAMLIGAAIDAALALATVGPPSIEWRAGYAAGLLYLAVAASALAFMLYRGLLTSIGPARAAYSSVLVPVVAMALSTLFEGYRWTPTAAAGGALALGGLAVALGVRR